MNELKDLQELVIELNKTNSANIKKEILKKYPQCIWLLKWVYSPYTQFNVTSKNLKKRKDLVEHNQVYDDGIKSLLHDLNGRVVTGHTAISCVNGFIEDNKEYEELIYCIIDKNLKTRTDAKLINSVFPNLIPQFNVALAKKYEDHKDKIDFKNDDHYISRKLDGVRVIAKVSEDSIRFFSREGKEFFTLGKVADEIKRILPNEISVFDGEICLIDENENESFSGLMKLIRKKDYTIENPRLKVFDILTHKEFDNEKGNTLFSNRFPILEEIFKDSKKILTNVEQKLVRSDKEVQEFLEYAVSQGWEGAILRKDTGYKGKRSNDLLKVKKFSDAEYTINNVEMGLMRVIVDSLEVEEEMLASVKIEHKGNVVSVGSGFDLEERRKYYKNPELIIGKKITVKYFEETQNQKGEYSLRFPIMKHIHLHDRD